MLIVRSSSRVPVRAGAGRHARGGAGVDAEEETAVLREEDGADAESREVPGDADAEVRATETVHRRIQARRESVELEARVAFRQLVTCAVGGLVLGAALIGLVFFTPLLRVRSVEVVGAVHESATAVRETAVVPRDRTLAEISVGEVAANVETLPWVRRAEVSRRLPWTVRIEVVERRPMAVAQAKDVRAVVDDEGVVLEIVTPESTPTGLPVVVGAEALPPPGEAWADRAGRTLIRTAGRIPPDFSSRVASLSLEHGNLTMVLVDGITVRLGQPEGMERKVAILEAVLEDLARRQVAVTEIDVSAEGSPSFVPAA